MKIEIGMRVRSLRGTFFPAGATGVIVALWPTIMVEHAGGITGCYREDLEFLIDDEWVRYAN